MSAEIAPSETPGPGPATTPTPGEADYEAICAAVMETERGRWFLGEYARRNRQADTAQVLAAIERLETMARDGGTGVPADASNAAADVDTVRLRGELTAMAHAITRIKAEIASAQSNAEPHCPVTEAAEPFDSVVKAAERATSGIRAAAEQIQEMAWTVREQGMESDFCDRLDRYTTEIGTACSLQDVAGQWSRKIIRVLRYLEARVGAMTDTWTPSGPAISSEADRDAACAGLARDEAGQAMAPVASAAIGAIAAARPADEPPSAIAAVAAPIVAAPVVEPRDDIAIASHAASDSAAAAKPTSPVMEGPPGSFSILGAGRVGSPAAVLPPETGSIEADIIAFASDLVAEYGVKALRPAPAQGEAEDLPQVKFASANGDGHGVASRFEGAAITFAPTGIPAPAVEPIASAVPDDVQEPTRASDARDHALPLTASPHLADLPPLAAMPPPAASMRKTDIAAHLFADVMALSDEERIALFT